MTSTPSATSTPSTTCDPATRLTKSLLGYGVIAGPFYVTVSLAQALTRDGFDLTRHSWSLLSNGGLGWVQIANFIVTGLMVIAAAVGLRRRLRSGRGATWAPHLIGGYGVSLIAAGVLRADPRLRLPRRYAGRARRDHLAWHRSPARRRPRLRLPDRPCFVIASRFAGEARRGWAVFSRMTGILFFAAFAGIATGAGNAAVILAFVGAVVLSWTWLSTLSVDLYRTVSR